MSAYAWMSPVPRTAGIARRALAFVIDATIVFVLAWMVTFLAAALGVLRVPDVQLFGETNRAAGLLWIVSIFELPLLLFYFTVLEGVTGRTPGKLLLGLRVTRADGSAVDTFHSFIRNLLRLLWVTPLGPFFVLADWWALERTELDQRLGDLAAQTVVLDERAASAPT